MVVKKKPFPFHDGGVNENAPIRVIRMVHPECPVDPTPEIRQRDGTYRPNPRYTGAVNCQQAYKLNNQGVWDVAKCESLGHDPWHTTFRRVLVDDEVDPVTNEVVRQHNKIIVEKRLNIISVSLSMRHSSGMELLLAKARGALTLDEYGKRFPDEWYEEPCQFRACTQRATLSTRFGDYCSERHARLVAADQRGIMRYVGNERDPYQGGHDKLSQDYVNQVEAINLGIKSDKK